MVKIRGKGCQAWLNGIGVFEPKIPIIFYEAYKRKNQAIIRHVLEGIEDPFFEKIVNKYGWHIGIKACLEARDIFFRYERLPMLPIDNIDMEYVLKVMKNLEIKISELFKIAEEELNIS